MTGPAPRPAIDRLFAKIEVDESTGCWNWTATADRRGYGRIRMGSRVDGTVRTELAYRVCYELHRGPVPDGLDLDHLCRNPACCNPDHLEPVTRRENLLRGNGVNAINAAKTHCTHGHELTPENTQPAPGGGRWCRSCHRRRQVEYRARQRADRV